VSDFQIRAGDRLPAISATITDGKPVPGYPLGTPVVLTGAVVRFVMRGLGDTSAALDAPAVVADAAGGKVRYDWAVGDTATAGVYFAEWQITFADGRRLTVPNGSAITVEATPGIADIAPIDSADLAAIRARIGHKTPPSDAELAGALDRLGSPEAVALEVLQGRYAEMIAGPAKWAVEGDFNLDNTASIKALEAVIGELSASQGTAATLTVGGFVRSDPWTR
jgi:hypothetical protein